MAQTLTPWRQATPDLQLAAIGGTIQAGDRYYAAALYVLLASLFLDDHYDRVWGPVNIGESQLVPGAAELHDNVGDIIHRSRQARGWTGAERLMLDVAAALFNDSATVSICDLGRVDQRNYDIVKAAIDLRHGAEKWGSGHRSIVHQRLNTYTRTAAHV